MARIHRCPNCGGMSSKTETGNALDATCTNCGHYMHPGWDSVAVILLCALAAGAAFGAWWVVFR